jgi:hypothetical protein
VSWGDRVLRPCPVMPGNGITEFCRDGLMGWWWRVNWGLGRSAGFERVGRIGWEGVNDGADIRLIVSGRERYPCEMYFIFVLLLQQERKP